MNASDPRMSIIVPTLNEERYIEQCLRSFQDQTIPRNQFELIVSDTRSKDQTAEIAEQYADRVVVHDGIGAGFGKNVGARLAKSPLLGFVDGDSKVSPAWVEGALHGLERCVGCTGPVDSFDAHSWRERLFFFGWGSAVYWGSVFNRVFLPGFNTAVRRSAFDQVGGFFNDNRINEDMDLSKKLWNLGRVGYEQRMRVFTSARRVEELGLTEYVMAGARFVFLKQDKTWQEHRKDTREL